jgi:hypothetical protein
LAGKWGVVNCSQKACEKIVQAHVVKILGNRLTKLAMNAKIFARLLRQKHEKMNSK